MGHFYGMTLLTSCLTWYKTKSSLDATVPLTVMLSRLFVCIFNVIELLAAKPLWLLPVAKPLDAAIVNVVPSYAACHSLICTCEN